MSFPPSLDVISGEQYRYALQNFRIAHDKVEEQRRQLADQEHQITSLRAHIAILEGDAMEHVVRAGTRQGGQSVDDFSIKNTSTKLEKQVNRWAADAIRSLSANLNALRDAALTDLEGDWPQDDPQTDTSPIQAQSLLRHALSMSITEGIVNCLIITNSSEANVQLTRIHEHLFSRDPAVACVWRRQTFSAAVESFSPEMSYAILREHLPSLTALLRIQETIPIGLVEILDSAYSFSRMLHGSKSDSGTNDFYRAFLPDIGAVLDPGQIELIKRCLKSERGEIDRVGACIFFGLVKITGKQNLKTSFLTPLENVQTVVRRAQVICECALGLAMLDHPETQNSSQSHDV